MHSRAPESRKKVHHMKSNPVPEKSFIFSLKIIAFTEMLQVQKKYNLANQLFRSGTAIGALIKDAQSPESISDFIHKMKIAAKEAQETEYWLQLCRLSDDSLIRSN
jgi:four helix bundle protein